MNYEFIKYTLSKVNMLGIRFNEDDPVLSSFSGPNWTPEKIQEIIDGIDNSRSDEMENPYYWANEDIGLLSNLNGVSIAYLILHRAGERDPAKLNVRYTHDEFIQFLTDFKNFVAANAG